MGCPAWPPVRESRMRSGLGRVKVVSEPDFPMFWFRVFVLKSSRKSFKRLHCAMHFEFKHAFSF